MQNDTPIADTPLMAEAKAAEARLRARVQRLADRLDPPFTAKTRPQIAEDLAQVALALTALGALRSRHIQSNPTRGAPETVFFARYHRHFPLWRTQRDLLLTWLRARPLPLYPGADSPNPPPPLAPVVALERMLENMHLALSPQQPELYRGDGGMHGDIPLPMGGFLGHLHAALRLHRAGTTPGAAPGRFLDVGCGIGLKLHIAAEYFGQADGLEHDPSLAAAAQDLQNRVCAAHRALNTDPTPWAQPHLGRVGQITCGDALEYDDYGAYDVIYAYRPIADAPLRHVLEERIVAQARPGCLLVMPYPEFPSRAAELGCDWLGGAVYLAKSDPKTAQTLLKRAQRTGLRLPSLLADEDSFVTPLTTVLRHWGHAG